ncbi:MAG: sugar-transfer associated ATP-grasp domain-containing protein [Halieaceae bacterium]|jgi:hypothetical protein|nr:sugar-transfer associated ATP-grasp domain-containing protein [Halieaceae bacterium]
MAMNPTGTLEQLRHRIGLAAAETGKSRIQLLREAMALRYRWNKLGFSEFFNYGLYDPGRVSPDEATTFINVGFCYQIWEELNPVEYWGIARDKPMFQLLMERMGFDQPDLVAIYDRDGRKVPGTPCFADLSAFGDFLRGYGEYPVFIKPSDGFGGHGSFGLAAYDAHRGTFTQKNGETIPEADLWQAIAQRQCYVVQKDLATNAELADIVGRAISTLRVVITFSRKNGPRIFRVIWRIPSRGNVIDNFWRVGNYVAQLEQPSGEVYSVVESTDDGYVNRTSADPIGARLLGTVPPDFQRAVDLAMEAATVFPMFSYQAWDIALTDRGPMILELNHNGDIELLQVGARRGILDGAFKELLEERGVSLQRPYRWDQWAHRKR